MNTRLEALLTLAATSQVIAFFDSVSHWPKQPIDNLILRWTENEVTYEISSRTLDVAKLAEVANKLR